MAHHIKQLKNLAEGQIYNYTVEIIFVMLRSIRRICNAIFCYNYCQFHREGDN